MTAKIGVIGSGIVGRVLAAGFARHGFEVDHFPQSTALRWSPEPHLDIVGG